MNDLVFKGQNDQVITTSLKVAEKFKKEHRNVLKSIRKLMTAKNVAVAKMFDEQMYVNDQGKEQPMFYMNRDGFTLLAMGFTGDKAIDFKVEYINAFNKMEAELKDKKPAFSKILISFIPLTFLMNVMAQESDCRYCAG